MKRRTRLFLLWVLVALSALLLSVSLSGTRLEAGRNVLLVSPAGPSAMTAPAAWGGMLTLVRIVSVVFLLLCGVSLIVHLLSREGRRKLLVDLAVFLVALLAATLLLRIRPDDVPRERTGTEEAAPAVEGPVTIAPPEDLPILDANPPSWTGWALALLASLAAAVAAAVLVTAVARRRRGGMARELASSADAAIGALHAGEDAGNVVIRCYTAMCRIVSESRGLERKADMTPGEFVEILAGRGVPRAPVRSLTGLFEQVRYGGSEPTEERAQRALAALTAIAASCREARG